MALPWSLDTQAQFDEKAMFAFRPMARAQWLLSQRVRSRLLREGEGLFVANPGPESFSGWVRMPATCLRDNFRSLENPATHERLALHFENGIRAWTRPENAGELSRENSAATFPDNVPRQVVKFWMEHLAANSFVKLRLGQPSAEDQPREAAAPPTVRLDEHGWPTAAQWAGMPKPLFRAGLGDFLAVKVNAFAPRWGRHAMSDATDPARRDDLRQQHVEEVPAKAEGDATVEETPYTVVYSQGLEHPRLKWAARRLELWKREPRARLTLRLHRLSSEAPEILYASFTLPCEGGRCRG